MCQANRLPFHLYSDEVVYSEAINGRIIDINGYNKSVEDDEMISIEIVDDALKLLEDDMEFYKILIPLYQEADHERMNAFLASIDSVEHYSSNLAIEVVGEEVSKGNAIETLCSEKDIALDQVVVFGDSDNNLSMFEIAGKSIAMGNAISQLKTIAHHITKSNNEDGIAYAINNWLL